MFSQNSKIIWQGDSWRLVEHTVQVSGDTVVRRGVIEHPGSVVLVPLRPSAAGLELLLIRQYRLALAATILELPAGTREADEAWLTCAQRELREETGFRAETFTPLGEIWPAPGVSNEKMHLFLAEGLSPDPLTGDVDETIEVVPHLFSEAVLMAQDGRIKDGKTITALLRAALLLNSA